MRNVLLLTYASTAGGYATVTKGLNVGCTAVVARIFLAGLVGTRTCSFVYHV